MTPQLPPHRARAAQKQQAILDYIRRMDDEQHYTPTLEEIRAACGFKYRSNAQYHINELERCGRIEIIRYLPRGIRLGGHHG